LHINIKNIVLLLIDGTRWRLIPFNYVNELKIRHSCASKNDRSHWET